ncbi:MAG: response regulator, partial [Burkholderiales bacterium]|nr:response regulator [Burkholderiales bacterium]
MASSEMQKVLVVDDDGQNRQLLAELLKTDYKVLLAKSGAMALDLVQRHKPDVILLDVIMPDMDGYEVLRRLKADSDTRTIPVIFISALDGARDEEKGLTLGASDYIGKPFHPPIVRARVRNHMQALSQQRLLERLALYDALT